MLSLCVLCYGGGGRRRRSPGYRIKNKNPTQRCGEKENFVEFLKISWFGVRICNFESKFSFFFHLQLHFFSFSFVFDGFPLFFVAFLDSGATGKENEKNMIKKR